MVDVYSEVIKFFGVRPKGAALASAAVCLLVWASAAEAVTLEEVKARGYIRIAIANEIPASYTDANGDVKGREAEVVQHVLERMCALRKNWTLIPLNPGQQFH
ncbi:hypothetical protein [Sinorhizobium fredii]|uniref:hypothetical protein n=1 Tax=Rhizobium fredii TaxID=380 RepID=UPI0013E8EF25|nr:hypothetical protein [Sinorhizobium fredii]